MIPGQSSICPEGLDGSFIPSSLISLSASSALIHSIML